MQGNTPSRERVARSYISVGLFCAVFLIGASWAASQFFSARSYLEAESFAVLTLEGLYFATILLVENARRPLKLLEPYTFVTAIYSCLYFFAPIIQFSLGSTKRYGLEVIGYTLPATILVILGHIAFTLGYEMKWRARKGRKGLCPFYIEPSNRPRILKITYAIWVVSALGYTVYQLSRGFSISYILSGGMAGVQAGDVKEGSLQFLLYLEYSLIGSWIIVFAYGRGKILRAVMYLVTMLLVYFGGTRAAILIPLLAPVVLICLKRKRTPSLAVVVGACIGLLSLFAIMQVARVGIRSGTGGDIAGTTLDDLLNPFVAEIDDFKAFYALLGVVPSQHDFLFGSQMIGYSLVLLVPRALWPGKPLPVVYDLVRMMFGDYAVQAGVAYPALGEYYVEFGVPGIIICMFIFGCICRHSKKWYQQSRGLSLSLVLYSLFYPALLQLCIRGYMPQNFTMVMFLFAPVVVAGVLNKRLSRVAD